MDKKSDEEKYAALLKWENSMLEIIGNDTPEVLALGRTFVDTKARIYENQKIKAFRERNENLKIGRAKGAQNQKEYAKETKKLIDRINSDLLKHADTARWTLKKRAKYIYNNLIDSKRTQINGKPYMVSTIRLFITGT